MAKKILVVDDEPGIVDALKLRLESDNFAVITAYDGDDALEKARAEKPDLMILDIMMPKKDGWTTLKEMKLDKTIKDIPVIVLTAKDKLKDMFELEGVKGYIVKPFEGEEVILKVKMCLAEKA